MTKDKKHDYDKNLDDFFEKFGEIDDDGDAKFDLDTENSHEPDNDSVFEAENYTIKDVNDLFEDEDLGKVEPKKRRRSKVDESVKLSRSERHQKSSSRTELSAKKDKAVRRSRSKTSKKPKKKGRKLIWFKRILALGAIMMVAGIVMVAFILQDTQKVDWNNISDYLSEETIIYDDAGKKIDSISGSSGKRVIVDYEDLPQDLVNAVIAIEDKTFWEHHGFNFWRMGGAVLESITSGGKVGGTSTITQQLARNLWLTETKSERSIVRKIKEAYYAIQLERHLSKEDIITAYLNTIALGQNSLGVQAASQTYFSKDVDELDLLESAALASLPQAPGTYAFIKTVAIDEVSKNDPNVLKEGTVNAYLYNNAAENRVQTTLDLMEEQGVVTAEEHDKAKVNKLKKHIKPNIEERTNEAQFFVDYMVKQLTKDIMSEFNRTETEANQMIYSGGLKIYTTLNKDMQEAVEEEFSESSNFPSVANLDKDSSGNIINDNKSIILYKYSNYFNSKGTFTLNKNEFTLKDNGDLLLKKGQRLNFYETQSNAGKDINIEFKDMYLEEGGTFYSIDGGTIDVPAKYKELDDSGNVIIKAEFFDQKDYKNFMNVSKNKVTVPASSYTLKQQVQQPQSSMVIMDHGNGQIKAMVGGRNIEGKMNFNRSTSPRQPGSAIKPISVYAPALESGNWTAGSTIKDERMTYEGETWPRNWYSGYRGNMSLRTAVEQSVNTISVKVLNDIGMNTSIDFLKDLGITTVVESGSGTDMNPAALALGGMAEGISPLQMTAAYATFPNEGTYTDPTTYTIVKDKNDVVVLESEIETKQVMDESTAFIMNDILRTTVTNGIAGRASISGMEVAGKTGTTSDNYDAWFVGSTPKYTAALWIGNDISIELSEGSSAASSLWSSIMSAATSGETEDEFPEAPSNVVKKYANGRTDYVAE